MLHMRKTSQTTSMLSTTNDVEALNTRRGSKPSTPIEDRSIEKGLRRAMEPPLERNRYPDPMESPAQGSESPRLHRLGSLDGLFDYGETSFIPTRQRMMVQRSPLTFIKAIPELVRSPDFYIPVLLTLGWYVFSLSISVYNKWMFGPHLDFHFPVLITAFHQLILFAMSFLCLVGFPSLVPSGPSGPRRLREEPLRDYRDTQGSAEPLAGPSFFRNLYMSPLYYLTHIAPCCLALAGDIGLSNASFRFVTLTVYTMVKTSSLVFVLGFGLLFRLEKFHWRLVAIVVVMTGSVMMMVYGVKEGGPVVETRQIRGENSPFGVLLVLGAAVMLGVRWSFTQILLKRNAYTTNPILTIFYLLPGMSFILLGFGLVLEGWTAFTSSPVWSEKGVPLTLLLMIIPGILAFSMTVCEFHLLHRTRVVTLSVAGIFKELLTIVVSTIVFGDRLNMVNVLGLVITLGDIGWYNYHRYTENAEEKRGEGYEEVDLDSFSAEE